MGFLDEVKRQQGKAEKSDASLRGDPDNSLTAEASDPGLQLLADGLGAYAKRLRVAMPNVRASYLIHGEAHLEELRQTNYHCVKSDTGQIKFSYEYRGKEAVEFETRTREECDTLLDFLIHCGLKVNYRSHADWRFVFKVSPYVPVTVAFSSIDNGAAVQLKSSNFETLGHRTERIERQRIDEDFLDHFKKCTQREANRFWELCGNKVPDDVRAQLQAKIAARQAKRATEKPITTEKESPKGLRSLLGRWGGKH